MDAGFVYMCLRFISCTWITLPVYHRDFWMADAWHSQLFCYEERICSIWWFCWTILLWTWMLMQIHFFHKHLKYIHLCTLLLVFHKLNYEIHWYRASSELIKMTSWLTLIHYHTVIRSWRESIIKMPFIYYRVNIIPIL